MEDKDKVSKRITCIFLFVLWLLLLILLKWNTFSSPYERDEGEYAYSAWILRNGSVPYRDSFIQKPPMIIYTYFIAGLINQNALWPARLLVFIAIGLTSIFLGLSISKEYGEKVGWLVIFFSTLSLSFPHFMATTANTEFFMLLPLSILLWLYISNRENTKAPPWFYGGVSASISLLYKPISLYVILFIFSVWILNLLRTKEYLILIKNILAAVLGAFLTAIVILAPIIIRGAWKDFWEIAVIFNLYYSKMWGFGFTNLFYQISTLFKNWWILFLLSAAFLFERPKNWWFYLGLVITSLIAVYQIPIGHYYLLVMPFLAICASLGIMNLVEKLKIRLPLIILIVFVFLIWPIRKQFGMTPNELNLWVYGTANPFTEAPLIAQKVSALTKPSNFIFVAGSEPEIYFYSKRKASSRFVITYPLIMNTPKRVDYQKETIEDLKRNPPEVIVYSRRRFSGLWDESTPRNFIDFLTDKLNKEYKLFGGYVWEKDRGYWLENLEKEDLEKASLLVYKKK